MPKKKPPTIFDAIKSFLIKTAKGIEQIAEGIDDIEKAFDNYSDNFLSKGKELLNQSKDSLEALKKKGLETRSTAIGMVQDIIEEAKDGLSIDALMEKSGLAKKQLNNILSKLKEKGLVFPITRGVYSSASKKKSAVKKKTAKKKAAVKKTVKKKTPKEASAKSQPTQSEQVLTAIKKVGELSIKDLEEQLNGFSKKSLQNTIFKLKKSGKIVSPKRGIYKAV